MSQQQFFDDKAERLRRASEALRGRQRPPREQSEPPKETGKRLGTLHRKDGEEIRINWDEYKGFPFLSIRLWKCDDNGGWWPDKSKGITIRVHELPDFADAVMGAIEEASKNPNERT